VQVMKSLLGKLFLACFLLALLLPGGFLVYISSVTIYQELALRNYLRTVRTWPSQPIRVIETKLVKVHEKYLPVIPEFHCIFSYHAGGRDRTVDYSKFSGHYAIMASNRSGLQRRLTTREFDDRPPPMAYVNPKDASEAVPVAAFNDVVLGVELAEASFAFFLGALILGLAIVPTFMLVRSGFVKEPASAQKTEDAGILKPDGAGKWLWLIAVIWMTPGAVPITLLTLPGLLNGYPEHSYWVPVGLQLLLPMLLIWRWRRNVQWWKSAGKSYIALSPDAIALMSPPRGRLFLAPMRECPDKIDLRYKLERRISSKMVRTEFKADMTIHRSGNSDEPGACWFNIEHAPAGVPDLRPKLLSNQTVWWDIGVKGRANGRRFSLSFHQAVH
jgi:hypothetical protein